jgi:hypothetical protein
MAGINRYDQATPARDNYFNTFVPLPLDQLTALGMSRQEELKRNQDLLNKAYDNAIDIKYIKESPAEEANYRAITKGVTDLAMKYSSVDLTNPLEMSNLRRQLRSVADPTLIKRMEESYAGHQQYKALEADMRTKGTWNDKLNRDTASQHNSQQGVYSAMPEAYFGREKLIDPYVKDLRPSYKGIDKQTGMMIMSVDQNDINRIANGRAAELKSTPAGQQEIRLFKQDYPDVASQLGSDEAIMNQIIRDYAEQKKQIIADPMPEYMAKAYGYGASTDKSRQNQPFENQGPATISNYSDVTDIYSDIKKKTDAGDTEGAKDLQYALEAAARKVGIDLNKERKDAPALPAPGFVKKAYDVLYPSLADTDHSKKMKTLMDEVSSTMSTKYAFGFTADQMSNATDVNGKKIGNQDFETISNDFLRPNSNYELIDINGQGVPKTKKKEEALSLMNTKDLNNVSIDLYPKEQNEFYPSITLGYARQKDGVTTNNSATILVKDPTLQANVARNLISRQNYTGAAAIMNPTAAYAIRHDNLDSPVTYQIEKPNGSKSYITTKRNPQSKEKFDLTIDERDPKTNLSNKKTYTFNSRAELTAEVFTLLGDNIELGRNGEASYPKFDKIK